MSNSSCLCAFVLQVFWLLFPILLFSVLSWLSDPADQNGSVWVSGAADVLSDPGVCGECVCTVEESDDNCMSEGLAYRMYTDKNICNIYM